MNPSVTITLPSSGLRPGDYRDLLGASPIAFGILDPDGHFLEANQALADLLGLSIAGVKRLSARGIAHPDGWAGLESALVAVLAGERTAGTAPTLLVRADGVALPAQANLSVVATTHGSFVLIGLTSVGPVGAVDSQTPALAPPERDRRTEPATFAYAATHDPLTGLANREGLIAELETLIAEGREASFALLDLDQLQPVDEAYGHATGDRLLLQVAAVLADITAPDGLACRLHGDEFAIIADTGEHAALGRFLSEQLDRLQVEVAPGVLLDVAASVGSAPVRAGMTPSQVLAQADDSMYDMKQRRQAALDLAAGA
jgi:diguanylate cyclase (GGDEF)-like protein/PAS domain S-box-containing protein